MRRTRNRYETERNRKWCNERVSARICVNMARFSEWRDGFPRSAGDDPARGHRPGIVEWK